MSLSPLDPTAIAAMRAGREVVERSLVGNRAGARSAAGEACPRRHATAVRELYASFTLEFHRLSSTEGGRGMTIEAWDATA